jgi:hypothetical protein
VRRRAQGWKEACELKGSIFADWGGLATDVCAYMSDVAFLDPFSSAVAGIDRRYIRIVLLLA